MLLLLTLQGQETVALGMEGQRRVWWFRAWAWESRQGLRLPPTCVTLFWGSAQPPPVFLITVSTEQPMSVKHLVSTWLRIKHSVIYREKTLAVIYKPCVQLFLYIVSISSELCPPCLIGEETLSERCSDCHVHPASAARLGSRPETSQPVFFPPQYAAFQNNSDVSAHIF